MKGLKGMKIVNNHIKYNESTAIKYHDQDSSKESDVCPFCGRKLYKIKRSNVMVCNNPRCTNAIYELVR